MNETIAVPAKDLRELRQTVSEAAVVISVLGDPSIPSAVATEKRLKMVADYIGGLLAETGEALGDK